MPLMMVTVRAETGSDAAAVRSVLNEERFLHLLLFASRAATSSREVSS